jgi:hypothetical protein
MAALAGNLTPVGNPIQWSLLFARQPEPDLEFTEEELDQTTSTRPTSPLKRGKKSGGGRPLLWILLLALIAGIGYIAMEPEQLMEWLAPLMGEITPTEPPPIAMRPKPAPPAPATQPAPADAVPAPPAPSAATPAPATPAPMPSTSTPAPIPEAPASNPVSSPMFGEGQKVTVIGNPAVPAEMIPLTLDPAGTKPGPVIRPGVTLSVLDGDLQPGGWVYSVRADDGTKGWISETRLRLKF